MPWPSHPGTLVAIGGALQTDSDAVWQRIVDAAGGFGARIAVFATAAADPARSAAQIVASLQRCGACATFIPVAPQLAGVDLQLKLHDPALTAQVAACGGVFFSGGAQAQLVDTLQPGGRPTALLEAVRAVLARGGVVAGTSAGAAVLSDFMFRDAMDSLAVLKGRWRAGQEYDRGFGLAPAPLLIDQHFLKRGRIGRLLPALQRLGLPLGLGVDENAAVFMQGARLDVVGGSGALLVDLRDASHDASLPAFNVRGVRLSYLDAGDRHDLATGITTPAPHKLAGQRLEPAAAGFRPAQAAARFYLDLLADGCLLAAMTELLEGAAPEVRGLACRALAAADDPAPGLGFEFRLYRAPGLVGWRGAVEGGRPTVLGARLDVTPVQVATPLFTPLPRPAVPPVVESADNLRGGPVPPDAKPISETP